MFMSLILVCTLGGRECQTLTGPVTRTEDQCQVALDLGLRSVEAQLPDNVEVIDAQCVQAREPV